jgi:hypothetical protein
MTGGALSCRAIDGGGPLDEKPQHPGPRAARTGPASLALGRLVWYSLPPGWVPACTRRVCGGPPTGGGVPDGLQPPPAPEATP